MQFPQSADLNLRIVRCVVRYVGDHYGRTELERIAKASGLTLGDLDGPTKWASLEQIEAILLGARQLMPDDATFLDACGYEVDEPRGAIRLWLGALSPTMAYEIGCKNIHHLLTRISRFDLEVIRRGEIRLRYRSKRRESRLICFTRHATIAGVPKMWGLPAAHLTEESCIAHGDDCCCYYVRYYEARRWIPAAVGLALGSAGVAALYAMGQSPSLAWVLIAALAGILYDQRVSHLTNRHTQEGINAAYLQMARDDAHARRELFELTQRQKTWGHLMEDEVVDKVDRLKQLVAEVEQLQPSPVVQLKRATAAVENPLSTIRSGLEQLRGISSSEAQPTVDRLSQTVVALDRKLRSIARLASPPGNIVSLCSRTVAVAPLAEELRNRLQALVRGKDVRVSVFSVRDAPEEITIDIVLFNRVVDNLLLNAAEFTERGSIVVEVAGTPDFLTIKISDTGGTLREDEVGKIFRPVQRGPGGYSYGAGLSVVVQLLASVGGKLDVMTHNGKGTTFWAHFPLNKERGIAAPELQSSDETVEHPSGIGESSNVRQQAVTVRKLEGG